jgi:hypothetical protein
VETKSCAVCGLSDARALVKAQLEGGARIVLCATHALLHQKVGALAKSAPELKARIGERRHRAERRDSFPCDELGAQLTAGFAGERRTGSQRRK